MTDETIERSYVMIKPDGVQRGLIGPIISRFENAGYKLRALKFHQADLKLIESHYEHLKTKPFFKELATYMTSCPVVCMVWEGYKAVSMIRKMVGATNPVESTPGTIRGDYCQITGRNIIHASDTIQNAQKEISVWFQQTDLHYKYKMTNHLLVHEKEIK